MKCPNCKSTFNSYDEFTLYDEHGALVFKCKCGGRLIVTFWSGLGDGADASCSFDDSGCNTK